MQELTELKQDVKDIKKDVSELNKHVAVYNALLGEHIRRTANLEQRVDPIEEHIVFTRKLGIFLVKVVGVGAGIAAIVHYLF